MDPQHWPGDSGDLVESLTGTEALIRAFAETLVAYTSYAGLSALFDVDDVADAIRTEFC